MFVTQVAVIILSKSYIIESILAIFWGKGGISYGLHGSVKNFLKRSTAFDGNSFCLSFSNSLTRIGVKTQYSSWNC